ncbi:hypothetical protein PMAYCL1PPCAC_08347, partial [Pristionchus mayeri]
SISHRRTKLELSAISISIKVHSFDSWLIIWSSHELHHYIVVVARYLREVSQIFAIKGIVEMVANSLESQHR